MKTAIVLFAFALLLACEVTKPPEGPGTEYPCGIRGVSCGNHMCCWEGDECNVPTCPVGMCCWVGGDATAAPRQLVRPQRAQ